MPDQARYRKSCGISALGFAVATRQKARVRKALFLSTAGLALLGSASLLYAQLEGSERGIPPIDSSSSLEVSGIEVDVTGETAAQAREAGWKLAQRLGWRKLWARTVGRPEDQAPNLSDSVLNQIVSGIVIEEEQIGPTRYVARLGLLFDRARTGEMLGVSGVVRRSAPMLVIPVMLTGSTGYALEFRSPWQNAWAQFRTSGSTVDYVRPVGSGIDPLLMNAAQTGRRSRGWWRAVLDSYGASDVVVPELVLDRAYPGGPATGRFTARHGPDGQVLGSFTLRANSAAEIPQMLAQGVQRLDALYVRAFNAGILAPNPTLNVPRPPPPPPLPSELPEEGEAAPPPVVEDGVREIPGPPPVETPAPPATPLLPPGFGNNQAPAAPGPRGAS
jgi:hypothetical protein